MIDDLIVHHLWFTTEATTPIYLPAESGSAIRGALVTALRQHFCPDAALRSESSRVEADAEHRAICPVCWLIALEDASGERGQNVQRPYTVEPLPLPTGRIEPGQPLAFGVSLVGRAINLFPYLILAVPEMGRFGLGQFDPRQGSRGRFLLGAVNAINPLSGVQQPLLAGGTQVQMPANPVTSPQIATAASALGELDRVQGNRLALRFHTPTRIVADSHLVRGPAFLPLFQRLLERVEGLVRYYTAWESGPVVPDREELLALANRVETVVDETVWTEAISGSRRLGRATPVSGYRGRAVYRASDWRPLLPWLLWGQSLHVGKNAVKGDGWFTVAGCPGWPDQRKTPE